MFSKSSLKGFHNYFSAKYLAKLLGLLCLLVFVPTVSFAAQRAPAKDDTLLGGGGGGSAANALKDHLSLFLMWDFADKFEASGGNADAEKTFLFGANYEFDQFEQGISAQVGATYDFAREIKNSNGIKISEFTIYGDGVFKVSPKVKLFAGLNYNFPSMSGAAAGATIKGKLGFEVGGSYLLNQKFAFDLKWHQLEMETSAGGQSVTYKLSGFMIGGRYLF